MDNGARRTTAVLDLVRNESLQTLLDVDVTNRVYIWAIVALISYTSVEITVN